MTDVVDRLFTDARVALPGGQVVEGWLGVRDGKVACLGEGTAPPARERVACHGRLLLPGLVDIHVHFRDPGKTYKEDFLSGSAAAACGGVTTVIDMPNTGGYVATPADVEHKLECLRGRSYVDFGLYALLADSAPHVERLRRLGVAGLKWFLGYGPEAGPSSRVALRAALEAAAEAGMLVGVHAEAFPWIGDLRDSLQQQGRTDLPAHGASRPPFVEALGLAEAGILAREAGSRLHVHHLSSARGLEVAAWLRALPASRLTAETCPHYLFLTEEQVRPLGGRARVNPPIRHQADVEALWAAIDRGEIDCVASDHAPHAPDEKQRQNVWEVESGLLGVETLMPMLFHEVCTGRLSLQRFVELTAERPAAIAGLAGRKGALLPGRDADLLVVDPAGTTTLSSARLHSKHPFTVYDGLVRRGALEAVYLRGEAIVQDGQVDECPRGTHVPSISSS